MNFVFSFLTSSKAPSCGFPSLLKHLSAPLLLEWGGSIEAAKPHWLPLSLKRASRELEGDFKEGFKGAMKEALRASRGSKGDFQRGLKGA